MRHVLFLLFFSIAESCLVVRNVETPACECRSLAMEDYEMANYLYLHPYYKNVTDHPTRVPKLLGDDCYASMYCEGNYSLVIFDTETAKVFGAYAADGVCDRYTQKWLVDDDSGGFTTYNRLFGVCVDYASPRPLPPVCTSSNMCKSHIRTSDLGPNLRFANDRIIIEKSKNDCAWELTCEGDRPARWITEQVWINDEIWQDKFYAVCDPVQNTWTLSMPSLRFWYNITIFEYACVEYINF